jgi:hypothetical protein
LDLEPIIGGLEKEKLTGKNLLSCVKNRIVYTKRKTLKNKKPKERRQNDNTQVL